MNSVGQKREVVAVGAIFSLFAIAIMAWIPRFAEVKQNLDLSNGEFGTLISTGSIGAVTSLFTMGHVVHKLGVKWVLLANSFLLIIAFNTIVHTKSSLIFFICNIALGFGISGFHIALSAQAFHTIDRIKTASMAQFHGMWAVGTLITAIVSGLLVNHLSLATHIGICVTVSFLAVAIILQRITPVLVKANQSPDTHLPLRSLFTSFRIDWLIGGGLLCASVLEFCTGDWVSIYGREEVGVSAGLASIPYILFMAAMIAGRLGGNKLGARFEIEKIIRVISLVGGLGFMAALTLASYFSSRNQLVAFLFLCLAFTLAGVGSSLIAPAFYTAANKRSKLPSAVVVGHIGVVNNVLIFICKAIVAWTAQITGSLTLALMIPALFMVAASFFAKATRD
jgi:MFS family permease